MKFKLERFELVRSVIHPKVEFCADRQISKLVYTLFDFQSKNSVRVLLICQCQADVRKLILAVMSVFGHRLICLFVDIFTFTCNRYLGKTKIFINCHCHLRTFFPIPLDVFISVCWSC